MSFIKLCQLSNDSYIEDCDKQIVLAVSVQYPLELNCEVIDWEDANEFAKRGKVNSFTNEVVVINEQPEEIREAVYQQLLVKYPELIK